MSHPDPSYDHENSHSEDYDAGKPSAGDRPPRKAKGKALASKKKIKHFSGGVKGLKEMMNQPASKHWFARLPKE